MGGVVKQNNHRAVSKGAAQERSTKMKTTTKPTMKVILLTEVYGKGYEGDVICVKKVYANNCLIPARLAVEATPSNLKMLELRTNKIKEREEKRIEEAKTLQRLIDGKEITIGVRKTGDNTYEYPSRLSIHLAIKNQLGIDIEQAKILIDKPYYDCFEDYTLSLNIYRNINAEIALKVRPKK